MYIQTENTPNPNTLKFLPGVEVLKNGTRNFSKSDSLTDSALAQQLFEIDEVEGVFFGKDFISVTKKEEIKWDQIRTFILAKLVDYFLTGEPVVNQPLNTAKKAGNKSEKSSIENQIIDILDTKIRPAVAQDGGDIIYNKFEDGVVYLELHGACQGCPSSTITLKQGIENMLKHFVPEVKSVESI